MKLIEYGQNAKSQLRAGVNKLEKAVASTMGPGGNPVILDNVMGDPIITADGVTVSEEVELLEAFAQTGVALVKSVARQTNRDAGDGTTTSIVLANAIIEQYYNAEEKAQVSLIPYFVKKGMEKAHEDIVNLLDEHTLKIKEGDRETMARIATISARGDREMGELIADAFIHSGTHGQVVLEEGRSQKSSVDLVTGYQLDKGVYLRDFVNEEERGMCVLRNPMVYVFKQSLKDNKQIFPMLEWAVQSDRPIVLVAPEVEEVVLASLVTNNNQGRLMKNICFVEAPDFGDKQELLLEDLCFMIGATLIDNTVENFKSKMVENYGTCEQFMATKSSSVFINNLTSPELVNKKTENLKDEVGDEKFLELRKARLHGRLAKIVLGAGSSVEMKEKRDRVEDALNATKAAIEDGFIPGAGSALLWISNKLKKSIKDEINDDTESRESISKEIGYNTIVEAIRTPAIKIIGNIMGDDTSTIELINNLSNEEINIGYDVRTMEKVNLIDLGVIDPVKVTKTALKAAYSVASTIISTSCVIAVTGESGDLRL